MVRKSASKVMWKGFTSARSFFEAKLLINEENLETNSNMLPEKEIL